MYPAMSTQEPEDISVQKPVPFSPPEVSYRSGRPRSWPILMGEDAHAAVLGLDGVFTDPEIALADPDAAIS